MTGNLTPDLDKAFDAFVADHPHLTDRNAALTEILTRYFSANGYLPTHQEGKRPEELDATNDD